MENTNSNRLLSRTHARVLSQDELDLPSAGFSRTTAKLTQCPRNSSGCAQLDLPCDSDCPVNYAEVVCFQL